MKVIDKPQKTNLGICVAVGMSILMPASLPIAILIGVIIAFMEDSLYAKAIKEWEKESNEE